MEAVGSGQSSTLEAVIQSGGSVTARASEESWPVGNRQHLLSGDGVNSSVSVDRRSRQWAIGSRQSVRSKSGVNSGGSLIEAVDNTPHRAVIQS